MKLRTYRVFQAMILSGMGFFLLNRLFSGHLIVYIHQRYVWLVLPSAVCLLGLAYILFNRRPLHRSEESGLLIEKQAPANAHWRLLLMLIPLVMGVVVPISPLDAEAAASRQVRQSLTFSSDPNLKEKVLALDPGTRSILEWLWAFDAAEDKAQLEGQPVNLEGFVIIDENLAEGQFLISRFVISCCVADATAIGLVVEPANADALIIDTLVATGGWVRVSGSMQVTRVQGEPSLLVKASEILPIERPEQPYLYQ